jgi:membrane-bound serine protease (ClpP class)
MPTPTFRTILPMNIARLWCLAFLATLVALAAPLAAQSPTPTTPTPAQQPAATQAPTTPPQPAADKPPVLAPSSIPGGRAAKNIAVITIKGEIDRKGVMAQSISRRIDAAVRDGADAIVFDIDTPGGSVPTVLKICEQIRSSPVRNTVAWINPEAFSGGAIIALACREIVVNDKASFGDAMPIFQSPLNLIAGGANAPKDPELLKKVLPPLISEVTQSARDYNTANGAYLRDEYLVQAIIANDVELWFVRNKSTGTRMCIDRAEFELLFPGVSTAGATRLPSQAGSSTLSLPSSNQSAPNMPVPAGSAKLALAAPNTTTIAPSLRPRLTSADVGEWELIDKVKDDSLPAVFKAADMLHYGLCNNETQVINGQGTLKPINTDADLKAFFGAVNLQRYDSNWSETLVDLLTSLPIQALLVVVFLITIFVEMTHPGAIVPGVISVVALGLLIAPGMLIGMASWWEVLAIFTGMVLIGLEIFVIPGFGVPGILGLFLLFTGLIGLFVPAGTGPFPNTPEERRDLLRGGVALLLSFGTAGTAMYFIAKHFGSIPFIGRLILKTPDSDDSDVLIAMDPDGGAAARPGDTGTAITPMRPAGRIQINDQILDAVAEFGFIEPGTRIKVVQVDGMRIAVERIA